MSGKKALANGDISDEKKARMDDDSMATDNNNIGEGTNTVVQELRKHRGTLRKAVLKDVPLKERRKTEATNSSATADDAATTNATEPIRTLKDELSLLTTWMDKMTSNMNLFLEMHGKLTLVNEQINRRMHPQTFASQQPVISFEGDSETPSESSSETHMDEGDESSTGSIENWWDDEAIVPSGEESAGDGAEEESWEDEDEDDDEMVAECASHISFYALSSLAFSVHLPYNVPKCFALLRGDAYWLLTFSSKYANDLGKNCEITLCYRKGCAPLPPPGHYGQPKVLYTCSGVNPSNSISRGLRHIPGSPERILDLPNFMDDYYRNAIHWSSDNIIAVALTNSVYLWNASSGEISVSVIFQSIAASKS
ncbi:unnamed protein product [Gongylonema pulchrum]|uniref:WD_REPEATS_REGION domain-containing protein n=1 Tax=Gongylonema pulchrum TaxID=637853 RepID=A0A3P7MRD3_9BILA|nr:unnamed protein product [Gongylonema pulchrum]